MKSEIEIDEFCKKFLKDTEDYSTWYTLHIKISECVNHFFKTYFEFKENLKKEVSDILDFNLSFKDGYYDLERCPRIIFKVIPNKFLYCDDYNEYEDLFFDLEISSYSIKENDKSLIENRLLEIFYFIYKEHCKILEKLMKEKEEKENRINKMKNELFNINPVIIYKV